MVYANRWSIQIGSSGLGTEAEVSKLLGFLDVFISIDPSRHEPADLPCFSKMMGQDSSVMRIIIICKPTLRLARNPHKNVV